MQELPKRFSTIKYKEGILTVDNTTEVPLDAFTPGIMEQLGASASLVGCSIEGYPMTDALLEPLRGHKKMVNLGIIGGELTDRSFALFASMPNLQYLWLEGNGRITGSGLDALWQSKVNALNMKATAFDDTGVLLAAQMPKLTYLHVDHTRVTLEGILAVAGNKRIKISSKTQFSPAQLEEFEAAQRTAGKKKLTLDKQAVTQASEVLRHFFFALTSWEENARAQGIAAQGLQQPLQNIFDMYVCEKPRRGYRPLVLSASAGGTYSGHEIIDAEQVTKNKLYLYTKDKNGTRNAFRFLLRNVDGVWKIDSAQVHWDGWQRWGL